MGFWDTFWKVWQVRTSVRIQENLESTIRRNRQQRDLNSNLEEIHDELEKKREAWDDQLEASRRKNNK
jgi:DNA-binding transcriptional regulator GbsR (MarR family)